MKKIITLILFLLLLFSCKTFESEYYVHISVVESPDIVFVEANPVFRIPAHFETTKNVVFECEYHLVPADNSIDIGSVEVHSTEPEVITILKIDDKNCRITAKALKEGVSKIKIITQDYHSSTSLYIEVK